MALDYKALAERRQRRVNASAIGLTTLVAGLGCTVALGLSSNLAALLASWPRALRHPRALVALVVPALVLLAYVSWGPTRSRT